MCVVITNRTSELLQRLQIVLLRRPIQEDRA